MLLTAGHQRLNFSHFLLTVQVSLLNNLNVPTFHARNSRDTDDHDLIVSRVSSVSYSGYPKVDPGLEILCHNYPRLLPNVSTFFPLSFSITLTFNVM
jgi:hypothetical protein